MDFSYYENENKACHQIKKKKKLRPMRIELMSPPYKNGILSTRP